MKIAFAILLLFFGMINPGSDKFLIDKISTKEIKKIEKAHNSKKYKSSSKISLSESYYPFVNEYDIVQPVLFKRVDDDFMPYKVSYFFDEDSKDVKLISYSWDKGTFITNFFELQSEMKDEFKRFDEYSNKFDEIQTQLISKLGPPSEGNGDLVKEETTSGESWTRNIKWIDEDRTVALNMIFTPKGWQGAIGTYRVRLKVYWE